MKFTSLVLLSAIASIVSAVPAYADVTGSPSSVLVKVYKFGVSTNADCSNPTTVIDNSANPQYADFSQNPELGSGPLAAGTYPCIIIEMSDILKFTVASDVGTHCTTGTTYTIDVCRSAPSKLLDGTSVTCSSVDGTEDRVALYISTAATTSAADLAGGNSSSNPFMPPTSGNEGTQGLNLTSSLTVSSSLAKSFVADFTNQVKDTGSSCDCGPPVFSFK